MVDFSIPSSRYVKTVMDGLSAIDETQLLDKDRLSAKETIVDWQNHDPDTKFESAMSIHTKKQRLLEMTIRFGPVATYELVSMSQRQSLEADWVDVVLDTAISTNAELDIDGENIDLGDMYISDYARPHLRVFRKEEGYDITATELIDFIAKLNERHKREFGTLEQRLTNPRFANILDMR